MVPQEVYFFIGILVDVHDCSNHHSKWKVVQEFFYVSIVLRAVVIFNLDVKLVIKLRSYLIFFEHSVQDVKLISVLLVVLIIIGKDTGK